MRKRLAKAPKSSVPSRLPTPAAIADGALNSASTVVTGIELSGEKTEGTKRTDSKGDDATDIMAEASATAAPPSGLGIGKYVAVGKPSSVAKGAASSSSGNDTVAAFLKSQESAEAVVDLESQKKKAKTSSFGNFSSW
jgi:hypothetical protein